MKAAMALLVVVALGVATGVEGQFLNNLRKINPGKVTLPIAKKTPQQLAQAVADTAEKAVPKDIAGKLEDALNSSSVSSVSAAAEDVKEAAVDKIGDAFRGVTGKANVSQAVEAAKPEQKKLADALAKAGEALQKGADAIVNASSSSVEGSLKDASSKAFNATGATSAFSGVRDALEKASPEDVASELRKVTPQVAEAINRTSHEFATKLKETSPKAIALVNRTGNKMANKISPKHIPEDSIEGDPDDGVFGQRSWVGLSGVLLLVLTVVAGYLVSLRFKSSQRSPMLLSDALDSVRPGSSSRTARNVQMTTQEPFFSQF